MNKIVFYIIGNFLILLLVTGCVSKRVVNNATDLDIASGEWTLISLRTNSHDDFLFPKLERMPTLKVDRKGASYGGYDSCNNFSGIIELKNDSIKFTAAISTLRGCMDNLGVDNLLRTAFEQINNYSINNKELHLKKDSVSMIIYKH